MSTAPATEIILGCDPEVRIVIKEDDGNLALEVYAEDPANTDLDALFFNLTDDNVITNLNYYPAYDEGIGSNGENITGIDMQAGTQNQLNNGAQIQETYDVKLEFGTIPYSSEGDVDQAAFTIWVEGEQPLTAESLDLTNMTAVVNTDNGGGLALTGGINGGQANTEVVMETVTVISEDFEDGVSDDIDTGDWRVTRSGELMTNSRNEGEIALEAVQSDGPVSLTFDVRTNDSDNFENSGRYQDEMTVQVRVDNGEWVTLDTFEVNDDGTALVGDQTGQSFGDDGGTLTYSGGELDSGGTVEFRIVSDVTARDEKIFIDDIQVTVTDEVIVEGEDTTMDHDDCEDFEAAEAGDVVHDQFDGFTVTAQRAGDDDDSENDAMIFDTDNPTGGDNDLGFDGRGNVIIISEDNDSDDPDDNARGGTISFEFDEVSDVSTVTLLDIEGNGTTIDLYDADGELINTIPVVGTGDNTAQEVEINATGVAFMDVNLDTSGAVDDMCFTPTDGGDDCPDGRGQYAIMYDDLMLPPATEEELAALEAEQNAQDDSATDLMLV